MADAGAADAEAAAAAAANAGAAENAAAEGDNNNRMDFLAGHCADIHRYEHQIADIREQRKQLAEERKLLSRRLRNETKKKQRLVQKSSKLSAQELVAVLQGRHDRIAQAKAKAKAKAAPTQAEG